MFGDRWQLEELTVNYRTPSQIAEAAARMANAAGLVVSAPKAVREGRWSPVIDRVEAERSSAGSSRCCRRNWTRIDGGLLAVIADGALLPQATAALREVYGHRVGTGAGSYEQDIVVISPREAKGLEFDGVVVLEPAAMLNHEHGRVGDLYVAMTRPTQRLRLIAAAAGARRHRGLSLSATGNSVTDPGNRPANLDFVSHLNNPRVPAATIPPSPTSGRSSNGAAWSTFPLMRRSWKNCSPGDPITYLLRLRPHRAEPAPGQPGAAADDAPAPAGRPQAARPGRRLHRPDRRPAADGGAHLEHQGHRRRVGRLPPGPGPPLPRASRATTPPGWSTTWTGRRR